MVDVEYGKSPIPLLGMVLSESRTLIYGPTPLTADQERVMASLKLQVQMLNQTADIDKLFLPFPTLDAMDAYYANNSLNCRYGLYFNSTAPASASMPFEYSIRMDSADLPSNTDTKDSMATSRDYFTTGFSTLQLAVDQSILMSLANYTEGVIVYNQLFPDPYTEVWQQWRRARDEIYITVAGIFITAALFMFSFRLVTELVIEKETKIREGMKMMGMSDMAYFLSWNITSLYISVPVTFLIIVALKVTQIIYHANFGVVLVLFFLYLFTLLLLGNILSLFFDKSKFAGLLSYFFVLILAVAGIFVAKADMSRSAKLILSLLSPIAFNNASYSMALKDKDGIDPSTSIYATEYQIIGMLAIDCVLYTLLFWYLEKVVPGEFGTTQSLFFFLKPSYWRKTKPDYSSIINDVEAGNDDVELIPMEIRAKVTVSIRNLGKEFNTGNGLRVAVDGLYLDMYQDQIHAFLGHNGAGKSTTIGMLTGLMPPTKGDAIIQGNSIVGQMGAVRQTIGVCPQHDIIWKELTVLEHLTIYAALKGVPSHLIAKTAEDMAVEVGLADKINAPAGSMSGGQKRKLCLGIAFIGRSEVIFLDEVTSGMDPLSRRGVWDFLLKYKQGRTIILTTHFMDEADFLGDRIAIISHGRLRCDGSSLFLKKKFGIGYLLTLAKQGACDSPNVIKFVQSHIPDAAVLSDAGTELSLRLPSGSVDKFVDFFRDLDNQKPHLGIGNYGISVTTMEEVFLRIGQESTQDGRQFSLTSNAGFDADSARAAISTSSTGRRVGQQLRGLLAKRISTSLKDLKGFFLSILLPALIIIASIVVYRVVKLDKTLFNEVITPLTFSMDQFGANNFVPIHTVDGNVSSLLSSPYASHFVPVTDDFTKFLEKNFTNDAGALLFETSLNPSNAPFDPTNPFANNLTYNAMYNTEWLHSLPAHMNLVHDALTRSASNNQIAGIRTTSLPFKHVLTLIEIQVSSVDITAILYFIMLFMAGYALMAGSFAGNICSERAFNIKRLLYISGCKKHVYWLSNLIWDYFFAALLIIIVTIALAVVEENFRKNIGLAIIAQVFYCVAIIPLAYLFSYRFRTHGKATGAIFGIFYAIGLVFIIAMIYIRVRAISNMNLDTQRVADIMDHVFYALSPLYCLGRVLLNISNFPGLARLPQVEIKNQWALNACGYPLLYLTGHMILWLSWLFILDLVPEIRGKLRNPRNVAAPSPPHNEDSDVTAERLRVRSMSSENDEIVVIKGLHKLFPKKGKNPAKNAVYNTTLGIPRGQTFGLLGMNGAGKTTTLSMLAGDIGPTSGAATLNGYDLITQRSQALASIGSCPQFDALVPLLTAREHLRLYARIKGVPENLIEATVEAFVSMMDLTGIANSNVGGYSGGNKRKLSLSIAMLGNPAVVFLDEPSTGCDPQVRRFMWNVISELGRNKVIIITTHSMEECEALCQRISIMKDGQFTCLGSNQHVKSKFGSGYSIDIKFKKEHLENGANAVLQAFPGSFLLDRHDLMANFELPNPANRPILVSEIFSKLQHNLAYLLDDYSVSQTSLEQGQILFVLLVMLCSQLTLGLPRLSFYAELLSTLNSMNGHAMEINMEFCSQLGVLLHKNLLLKKKSKIGICCEIVFPLVIVSLLFMILGIIQSFDPNYDSNSLDNLTRYIKSDEVLLYGPTPLTKDQFDVMDLLMARFANESSLPRNQTDTYFMSFADVTSIDKYYANHSADVFAGIWFDSQTAPSANSTPFSYSIRVDPATIPATDKTYDRNSDALSYTQSGFASLQAAMDLAILSYYGVNTTDSPSASATQRFPNPFTSTWQSWNDARDAVYKNAGGVFVTAALFMFAFRLITDLVIEKETKIKEGMKMMGMGDMAYFLSWTITTCLIGIPVASLILVILKSSQVIYHTGWGTLFLIFIPYFFSLILIGFICSIFFNHSKFAGILSYLLILALSISGIFVAKADFSRFAKLAISLFSPVAYACVSYSMAVEDLVDVMTANGSYLLSTDDAIEYGTSKPWYFCFQLSYWRSEKSSLSSADDLETTGSNEDIEVIPMDIRTKVTVSIRNLRKEFNTGNGLRVAVNDLCLDMYQDQIHAFLGHNGAGKSTTIGMLTGLIGSTGGDALVQGYSIRNQMNKVRRTLGVCPQHDILWDSLTVLEHLTIYAALKGVSGKNIAVEAHRLAMEVGLTEKINAPSSTLSGGQK
eukprot:gene12374-14517_t